MLVAQEISYTRQQRFLTREISMQIPEGAFFTLAGPNGAGKSTLLRQLTGAIQPTHGRVLLKGKDLREWKKLDLALVRGVLSQYTQVAFTLSV
ncbi:MAG: ATP-binding cassette domain-containing protein, partial [Saprospiraceae bacterium]|nr:ATP-binding cassette domain-containing protein [Saprospiraceae bacterium]